MKDQARIYVPWNEDTENLIHAMSGLGYKPFAHVVQNGRLLGNSYKISTPNYLESKLRWILGREIDLRQYVEE